MTVPSRAVRVAAVQAAPAFLDLEGSLDRLEEWVRRAAQEGVRIAAFAETWPCGLPGPRRLGDSRESLTLDVSGHYSRPDVFAFRVRHPSL